MSDQRPQEGDLNQEFRNLGKNLADTLRAIWESPERKRLQQDLENGLQDLGKTLRQEVDKFGESPTGQQMKADVDDVRQKVKTGEAQQKVRDELVSALRSLNTELERAAGRISRSDAEEGQREVYKGGDVGQHATANAQGVNADDGDNTSPSPGRQAVHPDDADSAPPPEK